MRSHATRQLVKCTNFDRRAPLRSAFHAIFDGVNAMFLLWGESYHCKEPRHLEIECPKLSEEIKKHLRNRQKEIQQANKNRRPKRRRGGQ